MKKINLLIISFLLLGYLGNSQVKDVSVTISPAAEYTFWDNMAGLEDGVMWGSKIGFGFGEYMELRGIYLQSYDLKTNFENFGLTNYNHSLFNPQDVILTRWGGELKANIGTSRLNPYFTAGTGIQSMEIDGSDKMEQIYASLGLGLKLNLTKRAVFLVEAKNTMYNFNAGENLLNSADKLEFGGVDAEFTNQRLSNWGVQGALQFYLGGRKPGTLTELDKAYLNQFSGGLRGMQLIIEPGVSYIAFDENSLFRDTWLAGGYAGFDFNQYIGIRGFYFQAIDKLELTTDFDNLSMYGMEIRARLNDGAGVAPYLSLGGGYLNAEENYLGKDGVPVNGGEFASGGLGLNIPLGKRVLITGGARAMITSTERVQDISVPGDLQTHLMYNAGIKFTLGKKAKSTDAIYQENVKMELETQMAANNEIVQQMKDEYENNIITLEEELKIAYEAKDLDRAVELLEEKNEVMKSLQEVEEREKIKEVISRVETPATPIFRSQEVLVPRNIIQISPAEFESLIIRILKATRNKTEFDFYPRVPASSGSQSIQQDQIDLLNKRIDLLEKLLLEINAKMGNGEQIMVPDQTEQLNNNQVSDISNRILDELEELNRKIEKNSERIETESNKAQTIVVTPVNDANTSDTYITSLDDKGKIISNQKVTDTDPMLTYKNSSAMLGINLGGATTTNFGARLHYDINNMPFEFMPEIYIGPGNGTSFGVSGNLVYPFSLANERVRPYAGVGLGLARINQDFRGNYNVIIGAQLPFIHENLSIDYTMRNSFDYNQLAVIYKLPF